MWKYCTPDGTVLHPDVKVLHPDMSVKFLKFQARNAPAKLTKQKEKNKSNRPVQKTPFFHLTKFHFFLKTPFNEQ